MSNGSTIPAPSPEPSSSSFTHSDRSEPNRFDPEERPTEEETERRLTELPPWVRPDIRRFRTSAAVVEALTGDPFRVPLPDALDLVGEYGVDACEGAILKTQAHLPGGQIRSPLRWLIATIRKGKGWRPDQVGIYIASLVDDAIERLEASDNATERRLAGELRREWGEGPANVVELRRAQ